MAQQGTLETPGGPVTTLRYAARGQGAPVLLLGHGAGAGQRSAFMVGFAQAMAARGIETVTFDFRYMELGKKLPDKAPDMEQCYAAVVRAVKPAFIGGKSMGGRIATQVAAKEHLGTRIRGIVLLGYPLHPPKKPEKLRVAHLPDVKVPMLFVQGTRDAFGTPRELRPYLRGCDATVKPVKGDHSFKMTRAIEDAVAAWMGER